MERIFRCTNGVSFGAKYTVQDTDVGASAVAEVIKLTVTKVASASGNVSISIRGATAVDIAVLDTDDLASIATKIAAGSFTGWSAASSGAVVTFTATTAGVKTGTNTFDGGTTGVEAGIVVDTEGAAAIYGSVTFVFKGSGDGAAAYPLAASILVLKNNVVKPLGDAVITFPANGTVKITDGSSTFTLEEGDVIVVVAQRADIVAE